MPQLVQCDGRHVFAGAGPWYGAPDDVYAGDSDFQAMMSSFSYKFWFATTTTTKCLMLPKRCLSASRTVDTARTEQLHAAPRPIIHRMKTKCLTQRAHVERLKHPPVEKYEFTLARNAVRYACLCNRTNSKHVCCNARTCAHVQAPIEAKKSRCCFLICEVHPPHKSTKAQMVIILIAVRYWINAGESLD